MVSRETLHPDISRPTPPRSWRTQYLASEGVPLGIAMSWLASRAPQTLGGWVELKVGSLAREGWARSINASSPPSPLALTRCVLPQRRLLHVDGMDAEVGADVAKTTFSVASWMSTRLHRRGNSLGL